MRPLDRWVWPAFRLGSVVNLGCRSSFDRLRMSFLVLRMILRQAQDERGLLDSCLRRNDGWRRVSVWRLGFRICGGGKIIFRSFPVISGSSLLGSALRSSFDKLRMSNWLSPSTGSG